MRINPHILAFALVASFASINASAAFFKTGYELSREALAFDRVSEGSGSTLDYQPSALFQGYVQGVIDTLDGVIICPARNAKSGQVAAIVSKYLKANPEKWGDGGETIVVNALRPVFPCNK